MKKDLLNRVTASVFFYSFMPFILDWPQDISSIRYLHHGVRDIKSYVPHILASLRRNHRHPLPIWLHYMNSLAAELKINWTMLRNGFLMMALFVNHSSPFACRATSA